MDTTVADNLIGALIDGRYRVRARVARGGMATVYTAVDERLERTVALKIIHPTQANEPRFLERFTDEAKVIARLTHPNVVAVYDQGTHEGLPYLVLEYVRGRTLRELLADKRRLAPADALAIMEQMLAAIAAAHRAGLVHRDVKPENVLVAEAPNHNLLDAVVKVADFGLARAVEEASVDAPTSGGQLLATVAYVAPELVTDGHADARADVYSAGVVLFEMLTGRVPYEAERPVEVAWQHVDRDIPPPSRYVPSLPPVVDDLVTRATRRDPDVRPSDAGTLLTEVQDARDEIGTVTAPARFRADAAPTVVVPRYDNDATVTMHSAVRPPAVPPERPAWSKLPATHPRPRDPRPYIADPAPSGGGLKGLKERVLGSPRGRLSVAAALAVLGLLVVIGGWWFGVGRFTTAPDLVGVQKAQVAGLVEQSGLTVRFDSGRFDEKIAKDTVLVQNPKAGQRVVSGSTVTVTLSLGPERYQMPDEAGKDATLATAELASLKLSVQVVQVFDDLVPAGSVVSSDPPAGTSVKPGTKVVLKVSKGRAPVTVPSVVGQPLDQAQATLAGLGLKVTVKQQDNNKPANTVLAQDPGDGAGVEPGATITLTVSKGPAAVAVPNVVGRSVDEARQILAQVGLQAQIILQAGNTVRAQNPPAGQQVPPGTAIGLWCFG
ncbi:Stk1 family PASTA domain-containing Ser/Thr kinase [Planosporangium mesophilum]|uniref:non-specific serine/threonine protein kinase n=1 Tax=Planosporangium mesophilum TaxID=689768 RepID=A0A8J3WZA3_9ACTN|nr:Stk1 family PASTA domain-containing Ser/Thr kinase [Planosporangium mesophilum]NJC83516.1 Stk1 family PASTA domain-containing Ser/Thr kinase [Planosporangium mesophilum]GII22027.1 serine/threonine protein kinase [Planosporangium mesophilum]